MIVLNNSHAVRLYSIIASAGSRFCVPGIQLVEYKKEEITYVSGLKASLTARASHAVMYDLFERGTPSYACSDYVILATQMVGGWSTKFVNGEFAQKGSLPSK